MLATLSPTMSLIYRKIGRILSSRAPVLLRGESGCGKEVLAHALHHASRLQKQKLLIVHCATAAETTLPQELYEACAAHSTSFNANGKPAGAPHHTLAVSVLLKNVEALSLNLQLWFMRLLQDKTLFDAAGGAALTLRLRLVATTQSDLAQHVEQGRFRQDFYYRLSTFEFVLPPLRERREDLPGFVAHFIKKAAMQKGGRETVCSETARAQLMAYAWPGNIRELEETLVRALARHSEWQSSIERIEFLPQAEGGV
ncbi:sigma-54-dependent Fis family transcriptional regulator, partial [candidate division KSB1 bacterium]|nr:sigma-54-dependent Fis family transcriptional regulator [candidate division KSB1 bacterium]